MVADVAGLEGEKREKYLGWGKAVTQFTPAPFKEPTKTLAALIASPESLAYSVGALAGKETPRPPPTITGAVITGTVGELEEKYGQSYLMGSIMGEILLSYGIGKVAEPLTRPVVTAMGKPFQPLVSSVKGAWKGSHPDIWLAKHSSWYFSKTGGLAQQVVGAKGVSEPFSLQAAKAGEMAWLLETTKGTSGLLLKPTEYAVHKASVLPHLISRGGAISVGYLRELGFEKPKIMGGLPAREISLETIIKTTPKTIPYLPPFLGTAATPIISTAISQTLGALIILGSKPVVKPKPKPKPVPIVTPWITPIVKPKPKPKPVDITIPWLGESLILEQPTKQKQKVVPITILKTATVQTLKTTQLSTQILSPDPSYTRQTLKPPPFPKRRETRRRRKKKKRRKAKGRKIGIFKKEHPVATAKSAASYILGGIKLGKK